MLATVAAPSFGFVLVPAFVQSFARRGSALLGAIGRRFSGQVEMGGGVV